MQLDLVHKLKQLEHPLHLDDLSVDHELNILGVHAFLGSHAFTHGFEKVALHLVLDAKLHRLEDAFDSVEQRQSAVGELLEFILLLVFDQVRQQTLDVLLSQTYLLVDDSLQGSKLVEAMQRHGVHEAGAAGAHHCLVCY